MSYTTIVGLCTIELHLPGVSSLKEKRSILKSLLARIRNTFNVSAAEVGYQDVWQSSAIAVATVTNSTVHANEVISNILRWIEQQFPDIQIVKEEIEIL
jgi:uncharacterized protein